MIQFCLPVSLWVINPIVNDPELINFGVDINTGHHPDPFDHHMRVTAVLSPDQFDPLRRTLVDHCVIKYQKSIRRNSHLFFDILPHHSRTDFIACQIPVRHIMTEFLSVLGVICQRIIDLTYQQVLAIVQAGYLFSFCVHLLTLSSCHLFVNFPVLRKSYNNVSSG